MLLLIAAVLTGLMLLIWSASRIVEGASATEGHLSVPQKWLRKLELVR